MKINEIEAGQKVSFRQDTSSGYNAPPEENEVGKILQVVKENCSEAITAMKQTNKYLYRGIKYHGTQTSIAFHGRSRENRRPLSTAKDFDETLNNGLRNSGMVALRSNSIFCTSSIQSASSYGKLYLIFPINGFQYTWNTKYEDFFTDYIYEYFMSSGTLKTQEERQEAKQEFSELAKTPDFANECGFINTNFMEAIESGHEIMISGEYYALYSADFKQYAWKLFK